MGGLNLAPDVAYANLFDTDSMTVPGMHRVVPGRTDLSLLFINLAAKTLPDQYHAPVRAMPLDLPALSNDELEAMRLWINGGAPEDGVVRGTAELLNACLPPAEPIAIEPLVPPPAGVGLQLRMPPWTLEPQSEHEVCFASYYDMTDQVPAEFRGSDGTTFRFKRNEIRQDPFSHHLIVNLYNGTVAPTDPAWGTFRCRGGDRDGQTCVPTDVNFCGAGLCATDPVKSVACIGFGPQDADLGLASSGFTGTQQTAAEFDLPDGVYGELPLKGMVLWDSHAFNLTDVPGTLHAWVNFDFAPPSAQTPTARIFDSTEIFKMNVPVFQTEEVCRVHELPQNAHLFQLSSHGHQRMKRWRTFLGAFTCKGGPADGQACEPLGYDFVSPDVCAGAPCTSAIHQHVGDCDLDNSVAVNEIVASVNIALGAAAMSTCAEADSNSDGEVSVDEILKAVNAALNGTPPPTPRDPMQSLMYVSLIYNDPVNQDINPPMVFPAASADERALTFCALYDNGFTDPTKVKRKSTSPPTPLPPFLSGFGGPCKVPTGCVSGKLGAPCTGRTDAARNASCDSTEGAGDGMCDACTLTGGVTTEDEMFLLLGQYYVP